jgi:hypothetical protein
MTKKSAFINCLYDFDSFGQEIRLKLNRKEKHTTLLGVTITIFIYIFLLYTFINLLVEMFSRQNPNVVQNVQHTKEPEVNFVLLSKTLANILELTKLSNSCRNKRWFWTANREKRKHFLSLVQCLPAESIFCEWFSEIWYDLLRNQVLALWLSGSNII